MFLTPDPLDCKSSLLKNGFCSVHVLFKTGFIVHKVKVR
jgi:hypothetical protein